MSKKKLIISIVLLLSLVAICIIVPLARQKGAAGEGETTSETKVPDESASETETEVTLLDLEFHGFGDLADFFTEDQLEVLKEQLTYYISANLPETTEVTFIPEEISYLNASTLQLVFQLSDEDTLSVYHDLRSDTFCFSDEGIIIETKEEVTYEKETDYSLPSYSAEEIESMQEGGYPDTETSTATTEEVQP